MINFKLIFFYVLLIITNSQTILPISNCLQNCLGCSTQNPTVCLNQLRQDTGQQGRCVPYYDGPNCTLGGSYYNMYNENGMLNNFANWSSPNQPQPSRQQCVINNSNSSVWGIGPFSSNSTPTKTLQFSQNQGVRRLLIKLGVAVSDSRIVQTNGNVSQQVVQTEQNGTIYITTINTITNGTQITTTIPFLSLRLIDLLNNGAVIYNAATGYQNASVVVTKCGYIYQYQFSVAANSGVFQQLSLQLSLPAGSDKTLWWLMDFKVEVGCSGFSVGNACDGCLTGFYPALTQEGYANGCRHCSYACSTCTQNGNCLTCQIYATLNANNRTCYYPSTYKIYNDSSYITAVMGSALQTNSTVFKQVYRSQNKTLNLTLKLANNQSYLMKFYIIFPISYNQNNLNFRFTVDGSIYNTTRLDFNKATLSDVNNGQTQLYVLPFTIDRMGRSNILANGTFLAQLTSPTPTEEFYIADITIVQYQCSKNCLDCSFNLAQTSSCKLCLPFYRTDTNCMVCANGFFEIQNETQNRCVKCFSNCKQCLGPSNYQCLQCYSNFELTDYDFNSACINKIINDYLQYGNYIPSRISCPNPPTLSQFTAKPSCALCLKTENGYLDDPNCIACWMSYNWVWGRCRPSQSSGLTFYTNDIVINNNTQTSWSSTGLTKQTCTSDYTDLVGVPNVANNSNHSKPVQTTLSYSVNNLPGHYGLTFFVSIYKIDQWATDSSNKSSSLNITVFVDSPNAASSQFVVQVTNAIGANICGQQSNEMIWSLQANVPEHTSSSATIRVVSPDKGIFVRQLNIYLGHCSQCNSIGLSYSIILLPAYSDNSTQTGLDAYITFNKPISFIPGIQKNPSDAFANSFRFYVDQYAVRDVIVRQNKITDPNYNSIKYFLPLTKSFINATVYASTNQASLIYTQDAVAARQLLQASQQVRLQRYVNASADTRNSVSQLSDFFSIITWIALIIMIITVFLGVGVVFQQFSLMLQLIYYHIYITSWLLPPTVKIPLAHASRMEHLNYFADISAIQKSLFGLDPLVPSNYIFTQYNIEIYFLRSIYPLIIINAIFIAWFIILKILQRFVHSFGHSPHKVARFFRSIPNRPLAYFDQIFRYQYLAVMWASMLQFTNFEGDGSRKLNLVICVIGFIIAFVWPFGVTIYTAFFTNVQYIKHSIYLYHDIYYLKISSVGDQPKFYLYTLVKTGRLLAYAIFIALFINQSIIGPVLLIFVNLIDGLISFFLDIYRTGAYLLTRLIENTLLIIAAILCLVLFGFSDDPNFEQNSYQDLGFGLSTVFVLMVINGLVRFIYLLYKKIEEWSLGNYDVGEKGELQNFDDRSPVKVPQSERL